MYKYQQSCNYPRYEVPHVAGKRRRFVVGLMLSDETRPAWPLEQWDEDVQTSLLVRCKENQFMAVGWFRLHNAYTTKARLPLGRSVCRDPDGLGMGRLA